MMAVVPTGDVRTGLAGLVADSDDVIPLPIGQFRNGLSVVLGDVYAHLLHGGDGVGVKAGGVGASAENFYRIAQLLPKESLGHLAAGAIVGAQHQDAQLTSRHWARRH